MLPGVGRVDTGVTAIAGRHPLPADLPEALTTSTTMVFPPRHGFLFTAMWLPEYTFWAYADAAARMPDPAETDGVLLRDAVLDRMDGWHPGRRDLVAGGDPATVAAIRVRSASPVRPWPTGPVTLRATPCTA